VSWNTIQAFPNPSASIPEGFNEVLENIDEMDFDVFALSEKTDGQELVTVSLFLMNLGDFFNLLNIKMETFVAFMKEV
jgi:hypothetical protein